MKNETVKLHSSGNQKLMTDNFWNYVTSKHGNCRNVSVVCSTIDLLILYGISTQINMYASDN